MDSTSGVNFIGTDSNGTNDATEGNVLSGNVSGIGIQANGDNAVIAGNLIGVNPAGTAAIANTASGVWITSTTVDGTRIGTDGNGVSDSLERNIISGNGWRGSMTSGI